MDTSNEATGDRKKMSVNKMLLKVTLKQWEEIYNKEIKYSEDLRNNDIIAQAKHMIEKINKMIDNDYTNDQVKGLNN